VFNLKKFSTLFSNYKEHPELRNFDPKRLRGEHPAKTNAEETELIEKLVADLLFEHFGENYSDITRKLAFSTNISQKNLPDLFSLPITQIIKFADLKREDLVNKAAQKFKTIQNEYNLSDEKICNIAILPFKKAQDQYKDIKDIAAVYKSLESGIKKGILKIEPSDDWKNICLKPQDFIQIVKTYTTNNEVIDFFMNLEPIVIGDITERACGIYVARPYGGELRDKEGKPNVEISKNVLKDLFYEKKEGLSVFLEPSKELNNFIVKEILNSLKSENPSKASMNLRQLCKRFPQEQTSKDLNIFIERVRFPKQYDVNSYLNYIKEILIDAGYQDTMVDNVMLTVKDAYKIYVKGIEDPDFGENSRSFSSYAEKEMITNIIRDYFNLTCIPSGIHIPVPGGIPEGILSKTKDETQTQDRFRIDYVIYTDVLTFKNENGINIPEIKPNIMLIGEYYGMKNDEKYDQKTEIKEATESYFADALGCGYIGVQYEDRTAGNWLIQVRDGLNRNNALYIPKNDHKLNEGYQEINFSENNSLAVQNLFNWINQNNEKKILLEPQKHLIEKYINLNEKTISNNTIKYNNFLGLIRACKNRIDSEAAEKAITLLKGEEITNVYSYAYVTDWYKNWKENKNQPNPLKDAVSSSIKDGRENNSWKYQVLEEMEKEVEKEIPENINKTNICGLIYRLTDKQSEESTWKNMRMRFPIVEKIVQAVFNLRNYIKKQGF
jgi:hypothetical protein